VQAFEGLGKRLREPMPIPGRTLVDAEMAARLRSAQLTNKAVNLYFSLAEYCVPEIRETYESNIKRCLQRALELNPKNAVAALNQKLFEWRAGAITDEELHEFLRGDFEKLDSHAARLLYLLFKRNIHGSALPPGEAEKYVTKVYCDLERASNLARELLGNPIFLTKDNRSLFSHCIEHGSRKFSQRAKPGRGFGGVHDDLLETTGIDKAKSFENKRILLSEDERALNNFFISNDDAYIGMIGEKEFSMVNVRSGKTVFIHKLPKIRSKATEDSANASPELTRNDRPIFNRNMTASIPRGATKGDSDHEGASTKQGRAPSNSQSDAIPVSDEQSSMVDKPGSGMRSPEVGRAGGDGVAPDAVGNTQASMD
jgi:hypothetical protein